MTKEEWKVWVKKTTHNKEELFKIGYCGCYYCFKIYQPSKIKEWCDKGNTAICPRCGIDAVIPFDINNHEELMKELKEAHEIGFKARRKL